MFELRDLFQWERFITPSIIKIFYWLAVAFSRCSAYPARSLPADHDVQSVQRPVLDHRQPDRAFIGVIFARIVAEFVLIMFRINEHLGAITADAGNRT